MAEEKVELRELDFRRLFPWTELFRAFQVALDPKKLLLAAAGILLMASGWHVLGWVFHDWDESPKREDFPAANYSGETETEKEAAALKDFEEAQRNWDLLHAVANPDNGTLRQWPWLENRGENPYLMVTGRGKSRFLDWLLDAQVPTLIEPLRKFFYPIIWLLNPDTGGWNRLYFLLITVWNLAIWSLFGGAITRIASVQVARNEKIGMVESLRFVWHRYLSYFSAPLFPLLFVVFMVVMLCIFGLFYLIPAVGDILVAGVFYLLVFLAGIAMAVVLVGLVGWPMMYATISAEGSDSFDAISRSYSYVYQNPWHYLWYALVAVLYGAVVVFFVGFMGSLVVYLGKWGLSQTPFVEMANRDPTFLYVYAPESFDWQKLLLDDKPRKELLQSMTWYNHVGAGLVAGWLYLAFLMVLGFSYSYFWTASTIIYLLMRRRVDDTDLDEVYLEDEDEADFGFAPPSTAVASAPAPAAAGVTMVDAPTLRTPAPAAPPATVSESKPADKPPEKPTSGDGATPPQ